MSHHYQEQEQLEAQKIPFLLDSLYCEENNILTEVSIETESFSSHDLLWEEEELTSLFSKETEYEISYNVFEKNQCFISSRRESVEWILKTTAYYSFSAQTGFLAVNYFDRFLLFSFNQSLNHKPWMNQLVAVTCLSLAAKVEETDVPLLLDLQVCFQEKKNLVC